MSSRSYAIQLTTSSDANDLQESKTNDIPTYTEVKDIYDQIGGELNIAYDTGSIPNL
jgi:hypothetical protein